MDLGVKALVMPAHGDLRGGGATARATDPPINGMEPALKPAGSRMTGEILVMATPASCARKNSSG
jgi:glutamate racemase